MGLGGAISNLISQAVGKTAPEGSAPDASPAAERRDRIVKSGAGLAIACVVIAVFILAASFLKSVLFGLVLAYFLLPLEKGIERLLLKPWVALPFIKAPATDGEKLATRASLLTLSSIGLGTLLALALMVSIALPALSGAGGRVKGWAASNETVQRIEAQVKRDLGFGSAAATDGTQAPRGKLEGFASWTTAQLEGYLSDKESQQTLASLAIDGGQGLVSVVAAGAKFVAKSIFDILLTFFFLFYFLQKMAVFERSSGVGDGTLSPGAWMVKGIFESRWMPATGTESRAEAAAVIDRICLMLRAWVRGYLSIIIIESVLYTAAFLLFGVPYAPLLGFIAGCTILLPFIGPLASGALTVCVCLGLGASSLLTIGGVLATYMVIHGVAEQLFLYPRLVGETIGLTSLETIIVVLLGGLFGGMAGMIFAVPAASVLKFLIPTVYHCWFMSRPEKSS